MVVDGFTTNCTKKISQLSITMGKHTVTDDFYVVGIGETVIVLGIQWLHSLGRYS